MEHHKECLQNKCRVCGKKTKRYKHDKNSGACSGVLSSVLGWDVSSESELIYPPDVCNSCYLTLKEIQKAKERGVIRSTNLTPYLWLPHSDDCLICLTVSCGGKPKRRKVALEIQGRPSSADVNRAITARVTELNVPQFVAFPLLTSYFLPNSMLTDLLCQSCLCIPNQPLEATACQHYICVPCIVKSCETGCTLSCNCCKTPISATQLRIPSPVVMKLFSNLLVRCKNE